MPRFCFGDVDVVDEQVLARRPRRELEHERGVADDRLVFRGDDDVEPFRLAKAAFGQRAARSVRRRE